MEEVKSATFVEIQAGDTTHISTDSAGVCAEIFQCDTVLERSFKFVLVSDVMFDWIIPAVLESLNRLFTDSHIDKLIFMRGEQAGVQQKVPEQYKNCDTPYSPIPAVSFLGA